MNIIEERISTIYNDQTSGASSLTRQALVTLELAAASLPTTGPSGYRAALIQIAGDIAQLRPSMFSITFYMKSFIERLDNCPASPDLPALCLDIVSQLIRQHEETGRILVTAGAGLINNGAVILTASYSSNVIKSLIQARNEGNDYSLFIARSQENQQEHAYGINMAEELDRQGVSSKVIHDTQIGDFIAQMQMVLLGADTVLADGSVINGYPSTVIAQAAKANSVPVYILCEQSKYSCQLTIQREPGFDLIPPELITRIITA